MASLIGLDWVLFRIQIRLQEVRILTYTQMSVDRCYMASFLCHRALNR